MFLAALCCLPFALTATPNTDHVIEEVIVTTTKREQGIYEVPSSLSVLDGGLLEERGITDLVDIGKFVPNLNVITFSAGHTSSANPFIRGIGSVRHSRYASGLDDDGFFDDFMRFPEQGKADQASIEAQLHGDFDGLDFVTGIYRFTEDGANIQNPTVFLGLKGAFELSQEIDSTAVFANLSHGIADRWRVSGGVRATRDNKRASTDVGIGLVSDRRSWRETSWDLSVHFTMNDRLSAYATTQSGYQSGQFPARPYCLFSDPSCFAASDNITAVNY